METAFFLNQTYTNMDTYNVKYTFLFVLLFASANLQSQDKSFEFLFATKSDEVAYNIWEDTIENTYILTGSIQDSGTNQLRGLFLKLSDDGSLIDSATIYDNAKSYFIHDIINGYRDSLVFYGAKYDTGNTFNNETRKNISLVFYIMEPDFTPIDTLYFPISNRYYYFQSYIRKINNGKLIVLGSLVDTIYSTSRPNFFLYEFSDTFDSNRLIIWHDSLGSGQDIRLMDNGNYWALINGFGTYRPYYYVLDTNYNFLSKTKVPNYVFDPFGIKWDSDTTFYITGEWNDGPDDDIGFMRQLRTDLENPDENIFNNWGTLDTTDLPAVKGGLDFNNKDSIFIGGMSLYFNNFLETSNWFFVLQTDSLLNIRWERFYGGDAYYVMWKLIATADGGCIAAGSRYDYLHTDELQRDLYVLKLNREGLLVGNPGKPKIKMQEAIVYPNPGTNYIKVRIAAQYPNSIFEVYDISGKLVLAKNITGKWGEVNTSFLQAGSYIYRIFNNDGLFETGKWVKQ